MSKSLTGPFVAATLAAAVAALSAPVAYAAPFEYQGWLENGVPVVAQVPSGSYYNGLSDAHFYRFRIDSTLQPSAPGFIPTSFSFQELSLDGSGLRLAAVNEYVDIFAGLYLDTADMPAGRGILSTSFIYSDAVTLSWIGYALPTGDYTVVVTSTGVWAPFTDTVGYRMSMSGIGAPPVSPVPEPQTYALMLAGLAVVGFAARRRKFVTA